MSSFTFQKLSQQEIAKAQAMLQTSWNFILVGFLLFASTLGAVRFGLVLPTSHLTYIILSGGLLSVGFGAYRRIVHGAEAKRILLLAKEQGDAPEPASDIPAPCVKEKPQAQTAPQQANPAAADLAAGKNAPQKESLDSPALAPKGAAQKPAPAQKSPAQRADADGLTDDPDRPDARPQTDEQPEENNDE